MHAPKPQDVPDAFQSGSLSRRVQLLEEEIAALYQHVKQLRLKFDLEMVAATLRSVDHACIILDASKAQVARWTRSGKLRVVDLDRRPRYRLADLQAFAASRLRGENPVPAKVDPKPDDPKHEKKELS